MTAAVPPAAAVASIRQAAATLAETPATLPVARALMDFLSGADFQTALGLAPDWRAAARRDLRDAALLRLRRRYFPDLRGRAAAAEATRIVSEYRCTGWLRDDQAGDELSRDCFCVLSNGALPGREALRRLFRSLPG